MDTKQVYSTEGDKVEEVKLDEAEIEKGELAIMRCPHVQTAARMVALVNEVKKDKDSIGGVVTCVGTNVVPGLGEPVFDKVKTKENLLSLELCRFLAPSLASSWNFVLTSNERF